MILSVALLALFVPSASDAQAPAGPPPLLPGQTATPLPGNRWLLVGGQSGAGVSRSVTIHDVTTGARISLPPLATARAGHTATIVPDGTVLVVGGADLSGTAMAAPEVINVATGTITKLDEAGLLPRAGHTATLLTDGRVLLAGGRAGAPDLVAAPQLWSVDRQEAHAIDTPLTQPRTEHTATLLPDGSVLLTGGRDASGKLVGPSEIFDPQHDRFSTASVLPTLPLPAEPPQLVGSLPAPGAADVSLDGPLALRFSKPIEAASATPGTISLQGPTGSEPATVVVAEGGRLVFLTPRHALTPDSGYTLTIAGLKDTQGRSTSSSTITFTTEGVGTAQGGSSHHQTSDQGEASLKHSHGPAVGPLDKARGELDPEKWTGEVRDGKPYSKWQALPPLHAPDGVTALAGQVLRLNGQPLANVTLRIGKRSARTDDTGRFLLTEVGADYQILIMDGSTANAPGKTYGTFDYGIRLTAGKTTVLPFTIWMPLIDTQHATPIPVPTTQPVVATTPRIPDLEIHIPADVVLQTSAGPLRSLTITRIPQDRAPIPSPPGATLVFTPQAHGALVQKPDGTPSPVGVRIILPNHDRLPAGSRVALWSYSAWQGGWYEYGQGTVSRDGRQIVPDAGVDLKRVTCYFTLGPSAAHAAPVVAGARDGDPVDLATGFFTLEKTDLVVPDVIPIVLRRAHRPGDAAYRQLGSSNFDYHMYLTGDATNFTWAELILADGARIRYDRISGTTQYDSILEHTATPTAFYKSRLAWSTTHAGWAITFTNGTVYEFPGLGQSPGPGLEGIRDRFGNRLTIVRGSPTRRILRVISPNGRWVEFTHHATLDVVTQVKDNAGRTVAYEYDPVYTRLSKVTDPAGGATEYTYTAATGVPQLLTVKDPRGITWLTNTYDANNRVTRQTYADGTFHDYAYTLDGTGKVTQTDVTNPRGYVRRVTFNSAGYPLTDTRAHGTALAQTTTYVRDSAHRVTSVTDALSRTTAFTYDTAGNVLTVTRLSGTGNAVTTTFTYESTFNQVATVTDPLSHTTTFGYDSLGNLTSITNPLSQQTTLTYSTSGQPLTVTTPAGTTTFGYEGADLVSVTDPLGKVATRFTDALGRQIQVTDPLGRKTRFTYDPLNQVTQITDALGGLTQFGYDGNGNLLSVTDARSNATSYAYNNMDRITSRTDPLTRAESYVYDNNGNPTSVTDRKSQATTSTYDALDRRTLVTYADASTTAYTYDAGNRITQIVDSIGGTISFTYDGLDRLLTETTSLGTVTYTYDAAGRRATMSVPNQTQINYAYDNADRLTSITQGTSVVSFAYDSTGRRTSHTLPNGIVTEYGYDAASRLTSLTYKLGGTTLGTLTYTYNDGGERRAVGGTWARTGQPAALASATYNAANHQLAFGGQTLTYDLNGNLTTDGTNTYTWNARNQLSAITGPTAASFGYDGLGRRRQKTIAGTTTSFLYDGLDSVQEQVGATATNLLTGLGIDERFVRANPSETRHFLADALGSSVALTDGAGTVQTTYTYEAFGATGINGTSSTNSYGYTGRESDGTGLHYYRARYYHPTLQRFISEDPIGFSGGDVNLYGYVQNRPLTATDPFGLWAPWFHRQMTRDAAKSCGMSDADAAALADATRAQDFMFFGMLPSFSTLSPWSAKHAMPGSDWVAFAGGRLVAARAAANRGAAIDALAQGLHALQDAYAHDLAGAGMWVHVRSLVGLGVDPDDPLAEANRIRAAAATAATTNAIRDFMKGRGDKPKCPQASQ
jgi:RHS repeat-associated protein